MLAHKLRDLRARRAAGESGFTLVELLVVVVIVVALAAIAVPIYLGQKDKAENAAVDGDIAAIGKLVTGAVSQQAPVTVSADKKTIEFGEGAELQSVTIADGDIRMVGATAGVPGENTCVEINIGGTDAANTDFDRKFVVPSGVANGLCAA